MNPALLSKVCGVEFLIVTGILSTLLTAMSLYLVFSARNDRLLATFLPFTFLPTVAGIFSACWTTMKSIDMRLDLGNGAVADTGFLIQMAMVSVFVGILFGMPALLITVLGRFHLAFQASGIVIFKPKPPQEPEQPSRLAQIEADAEAYLERVSRPR